MSDVGLFKVCHHSFEFYRHPLLKESFHRVCPTHGSDINRPFSPIDFVFPIQMMWRYPGEYFLSNLDIFMLARDLFKEHNKSSNPLGIVTLSILGKQNRQAKEVYRIIRTATAPARCTITITSKILQLAAIPAVVYFFSGQSEANNSQWD